ncbi:integrase catalytic domain-containing protein [Trichonephila clavipes]|nr:integrase catalytic domain-containing protein [Trichonephila clavipes]
MSSEPTPLPPDRVTDCAPFEIVGIDLAGPLFLKDGRKTTLTYVSENPEELIPLTPSMFLISNKNSNIEDIEELNSNSLNKRIKYRSKLLKDLRQRFRNEYLSQLIQKHNEKESRDPQIEEVVLVGDNKKRLFWALAKIIELIPGRDGKI